MYLCSNYDAVWKKCISLCREYLLKGIEMRDIQMDFQPAKEEYAINSRYLHRGFYCPSPGLEYIVTNMRRGRIAKRITKASRISNHYVFDSENKMRIAETYYPNGDITTESIYYRDDIIYGIMFDKYKHISEISVEQYENGKIQSYFWANCYYAYPLKCDLVSHMKYETYCYNNDGFLDMGLFDIPGNQGGMGKYSKYRFALGVDGAVIGSSRQLLEYKRGVIFSSWTL